jgi:histidinol phosphatase-like enzyme
MLQKEETNRRKPAIEYFADLLELYDADVEEIIRFGEDLDLEDLEAIWMRFISYDPK